MMPHKDEIENIQHELKWIKIDSNLLDNRKGLEKLKEKLMFNPFVPLGLIATTTVLALGLFQMVKGMKLKQQQMMRYRVVAQGATLLAASCGMLYSKFNKNK